MNIRKNVKIIFHVDMNMFFCSVAVIKNPSLKGKAFAIGRENTFKGVISTASYEARKYKIHSGMSIVDCFKLKPDLIIVEADFNLIQEYHKKFINLLKEYSSLVEVASIDEAYVDMTEISKFRNPLEIAKEIQSRLAHEYKLPCSIGIAPTLFLAKMASDMKKPLGLVVIRKRDAYEKLKDLSVKDIYGIGKKTYPKLIENNILTIGDFLNLENKDKIISLIGLNTYNYVIDSVNGRTSNEVMPKRYAKSESISKSQTYDTPLMTETEILLELRKMARELITKLNEKNLMTKSVSVTFRDKDFKTITRSKAIPYTNDFYDIYDLISDIVEDNYKEGNPLRLIGVGFSSLKDSDEVLKEEYNLFTYESFIEREERMKETLKELQDKYGIDSIKLGVEVK